MLRPIDTQTIYQQTPEVSSRQQAIKQGEEVQQSQFSNILNKETTAKQESVNETPQDEKLDHDLKKDQQHQKQQKKSKYKKKKHSTEKKAGTADPNTHIDIRI